MVIGGERDALVLLAMRSLESAADAAAAEGALIRLVEESVHLGVELALFKGLAIGRRWYPQPELRPAVDVDVFINPNQADRIGSVVEALTEGDANRGAVDAMVVEGRVFEIPLAVNGVAVDLHIDPMNMVVPMRRRRCCGNEPSRCRSAGSTRSERWTSRCRSSRDSSTCFGTTSPTCCTSTTSLMMDHDPDWGFIAETAEREGWTDLVRESIGYVCDVLGRPSPLPRALGNEPPARSAIWPRRIRLRGDERLPGPTPIVRKPAHPPSPRRGAGSERPGYSLPAAVVDDRLGGSGAPYPVALYRWRRAQRVEIKQLRSRVRSAHKCNDPSQLPPAVGAPCETL